MAIWLGIGPLKKGCLNLGTDDEGKPVFIHPGKKFDENKLDGGKERLAEFVEKGWASEGKAAPAKPAKPVKDDKKKDKTK